jgi:hypothetical protein
MAQAEVGRGQHLSPFFFLFLALQKPPWQILTPPPAQRMRRRRRQRASPCATLRSATWAWRVRGCLLCCSAPWGGLPTPPPECACSRHGSHPHHSCPLCLRAGSVPALSLAADVRAGSERRGGAVADALVLRARGARRGAQPLRHHHLLPGWHLQRRLCRLRLSDHWLPAPAGGACGGARLPACLLRPPRVPCPLTSAVRHSPSHPPPPRPLLRPLPVTRHRSTSLCWRASS